MLRRLTTAAVFVVASFLAAPTFALETDQYTPPPVPLADIAPQAQQRIRATIQEVVSRTNVDYLRHRRQAQTAWLPFARGRHRDEAERLRGEDAIAARLFDVLGDGLLESSLETWVRTSRFPQGRHQFAPSIGQSIYGANPFAKPLTLQELSPTINLFGVYLGVDKLGHFFQQGHQYYEAYRGQERAGGDADACARKAVGVGVFQEETFFGLLTVGVYSNADLASNYAGLKFYLNLTRPVFVNGRLLPPILIRRSSLWEINRGLPADFLRPFVTEHWNEAVNPNLYAGFLLETVRARFADRSAGWAAFYRTTRREAAARAAALETFHGEPYGHSGARRVPTVADLAPEPRPVQHAAAVVTPARQK